MDVFATCPLRVESIRWQPRPGVHALAVLCKATFALRPGESPLAPVQVRPHRTDIPWDEGTAGSLRAASDRVPFKRRVDVLVIGHAHAPHGQPAASLVARIALGDLSKAIEVHGDRYWMPDGRLSPPIPFTEMPLRWERAAGGPGTWNPAGVPADPPPDAQGRRPAPNLLPVGMALQSPAQIVPPAGLGPLAPAWPERAAKLGRHGATWRSEAWAERPLPDEIDAAYFNAAPPDQQIDQLTASEQLSLSHLHPHYPELVTSLEIVVPRAVVGRPGMEPQELRLRCDTLCIETDQAICTVVWRGMVPLRHAAEEGVIVVTAERSARDGASTLVTPSVPAEAERQPPRRSRPRTLPFMKPEGALREALAAHLDEPPPRPVPEPPPSTGTLVAPLAPGAANPLPFPPAAPAIQSRADTPERVDAAPAGPDLEGSAWSRDDIAPSTQPVTRLPRIMPAPLPWQVAPPLPANEPASQDAGAEAQRYPTPPPPIGAMPSPAPPPMLGATPTSGEVEPITARIAPAAPPEPVAAAQADPPAETEPDVDPADVPLERFAAISAEIAEGGAPRAEVLRAHGLGERAWAAVERHWQGAIEEDAARGRNRLRSGYDQAYVGAVEGFRGRITLQDYVHITTAIERGQADAALDELRIQRPALMPIVRLWTKRVASDPELAGEVMALRA
ncbi:MAG: DUF2169 domain-containing protein [Polyangiaceae bacterium]|nr:DUF2169 domain-containing protein [Polyangiaceae bacterium]